MKSMNCTFDLILRSFINRIYLDNVELNILAKKRFQKFVLQKTWDGGASCQTTVESVNDQI